MTSTGLAGVGIATHSIKVPGGGEFAVRGLSLADLTGLYRAHSGELGLWFERFVGGSSNSSDAMADVIASVIASAPHLAARAITLASGDDSEEAYAVAQQLPLGVQTEALGAIGRLTFTEDMPPKKVLEIVIRMAAGLVGPAELPISQSGEI